jgi:phospholipase C
MISITFSTPSRRGATWAACRGALLLALLAAPAAAGAQRQSREISDQEHALISRQSGQNRSFEELYGRAQSVGRGEYLGVEPDISRNVYRFKFMRPGGKVVWVDMDGRTGKVLAERM